MTAKKKASPEPRGLLPVRLSMKERADIGRAAKKVGLGVSPFMRQAALEKARTIMEGGAEA